MRTIQIFHHVVTRESLPKELEMMEECEHLQLFFKENNMDISEDYYPIL